MSAETRWPRSSARWPTTRPRWAAATPSGRVSAPTLESAVAAAAMAQDELGHARSTYPVLKALGAEAGDEGSRRRPPARAARRRAARLDRVHRRQPARRRRADDVRRRLRGLARSTPMAQRAKKILQEEGSHRVHARGLGAAAAAAAAERDAFVARLRETWEQAGRWIGPDDDPGYARRARGRRGHAATRPHQRELMRAWLTGAARGRGRGDRAAGAVGLGRLGRRAPPLDAVTCPFCSSARRRARRPVGRPDHHRPVALPRLRLLLRGCPRGLRRRAGRRAAVHG